MPAEAPRKARAGPPRGGRGPLMPRPPVKNEYPLDWPIIARQVKEAAGWRCERCGHPAEGPWKMGRATYEELKVRAPYELAQGKNRGRQPCDTRCSHARNGKQRMLTVDHLDGDKANVEPWNLAALCQVCHLQRQGRVNMFQEWMLPHSTWMQPHVDGRNKAIAEGRWP